MRAPQNASVTRTSGMEGMSMGKSRAAVPAANKTTRVPKIVFRMMIPLLITV